MYVQREISTCDYRLFYRVNLQGGYIPTLYDTMFVDEIIHILLALGGIDAEESAEGVAKRREISTFNSTRSMMLTDMPFQTRRKRFFLGLPKIQGIVRLAIVGSCGYTWYAEFIKRGTPF